MQTLLIMSVVHGWDTKQFDYVLAFPQAPVDADDSVLRLNRNVYGQVQAGLFER